MVSRKAHNLKTLVRFQVPQQSASDMPKHVHEPKYVGVAHLVRARDS